MARKSKEVKPLFDEAPREEPKEELKQEENTSEIDQPPVEQKEVDPKEKKKTPSSLTKYQKQPKYKTHVPHNIRIPREMREDMEKIAKKLKIPLGKNTGFFQEFTIDALRPAIEKAKKDLGIKE